MPGNFVASFTKSKIMAKHISTQILIRATPQRVWNVLTDFEAYPQWNPFIRSVRGPVAPGKVIRVELQQPGSGIMTMKPEVLVFEEPRAFRWIGHLLFRGLFDGEHRFDIRDNGDGSSTFIQSERFAGILVPLFNRMLDTKTLEGFSLMNEALKAHCEKVK